MPKILIRLCMGCGGLFTGEIDAQDALCPHCGHARSEMVDATTDDAEALARIDQLSRMRSQSSTADFAA